MGSDQRIRAKKVVARCCYGACFSFGFVVTTLSFAAMFWIFWCYFGLSIVHFTDTQRRAVVDYSFASTKFPTASSTPSPLRNTPSDIPETSLNQIPRYATASSGSRRIEPSATDVERRKVTSPNSESSLSKGDFAAREKFNKTTSIEPSLPQVPPKNVTRQQPTIRDNVHKDRDPNLKSDVDSTRLAAKYQPRRSNTEEHSGNVRRIENQKEVKASAPVNIERTNKPPKSADDGIINGRKNTSVSAIPSGKETDIIPSSINKPRRAQETAYPDPDFEGSYVKRTSVDEVRRGYDETSIPRRDRDQSSDRYSKGDGRVLPKDTLEPLKRVSSVSTEKRSRGTYPEDDEYYDRYPSERRGDRYDEDRYKDRVAGDKDLRDRYLSEDRKRLDVRVIDDRPEVPDNIRYSSERARRRDDRKRIEEDDTKDIRKVGILQGEDRHIDRYPDSRKLDRLPDEDRYPDDRRKDEAQKMPSRNVYRHRESSDAKYYNDERRRYDEDEKIPSRDVYIDRDTIATRYDDRERTKEDRDKYDTRPLIRDSSQGRNPGEDRYVDRYSGEGTQRNRGEPDSRRREDRYDDRLRDDDRYVDRYLDERRRLDDRYDDRVAGKDYNIDRGEDRYLTSERRRNNEDRYRDRDYDERTKYRDERFPYRETRDGEIAETNRNRNRDEESYRPRDQVDIRDSRSQTSRYDDDQYRRRVNEDRFREDAYKSDQRSLMSSRRVERYPPERQDYTSRDSFREPEYAPSKEYSTTYPRTDVPRPVRETVSEDRHRSISRSNRPDTPPSYYDRDKILPSSVRGEGYAYDRDEEYISRPRSDRRKDDRYSNERTDSSIRNTRYRDEDNRKIDSTSIIGTRIESSRDYPDDREYRHARTDDRDKSRREEINLERRSYSSEEDDKYWDDETKRRYSTNSRNPDITAYEARRRDYRFESSRPKYDEEIDEYKPKSDYNTPSIRSSDTYSRDQVYRYDSPRDSRYDEERDKDSRDSDYTGEDRDRHDRNRGDYDRHPTNKNHYGIVDNYGKDRESSGKDSHASRNYDRNPPNEDGIRSSYPDKSYYNDETRRESSENQKTRYQTPDVDKTLRPSMATDFTSEHNPRHPSDSSSMKSDSLLRTRDFTVGSSVSRVGVLLPDKTVRDKSDEDSSFEEEQPLSAKDVIEAALRHSETREQADKKVFYPVFDPRISNLTSPDIIRPSERRGTTITSKKKR